MPTHGTLADKSAAKVISKACDVAPAQVVEMGGIEPPSITEIVSLLRV